MLAVEVAHRQVEASLHSIDDVVRVLLRPPPLIELRGTRAMRALNETPATPTQQPLCTRQVREDISGITTSGSSSGGSSDNSGSGEAANRDKNQRHGGSGSTEG